MHYFLKTFNCKTIVGCVFLLVGITVHSQSLPSRDVEVTVNKTSSIVFPVSITSVDRGSRDVLAQKAKGVTNVLQVKAGKPGIRDTNLTVITADGKLHHFFVRYAEHPSEFITQLTDSAQEESRMIFDPEVTESELETTSADILALNRNAKLRTDSNFDMKLILKGIYVHQDILFFHLKVINKSNISFTTDILRFSVKDKRKVRRMASQEVTEVPLYVSGETGEISGKSFTQFVYAIPKFTIPDAKTLIIELMEKRGGRHLKLSVKNKMIVNARAILKK